MKFVTKKTTPDGTARQVSVAAPRPVKQPNQFRFLTPKEITEHSAGLSVAIANVIEKEVMQRFKTEPGAPEITTADAMQVAINALAMTEGLFSLRACSAGIPPEKVREIRDSIYATTLRSLTGNAST